MNSVPLQTRGKLPRAVVEYPAQRHLAPLCTTAHHGESSGSRASHGEKEGEGQEDLSWSRVRPKGKLTLLQPQDSLDW